MPCLLPDRFFVAASLALILGVTAAAADTRTVTTTLDNGPGSLRQTIAEAAAGDSIIFNLPPQAIIQLTSGQLLIDKQLTITGPGASQLTVAGNNTSFRVFDVGPGNTNVTISGLTIANGNNFGEQGGGLRNQSAGSVVLQSCAISANNTGTSGGGIANSGDNLQIDSCAITGNRVGFSEVADFGGGIYNSGTLAINNSTISGNTVRSSHSSLHLERGGGIYSTSSLTVLNCTVSGNDSAEGSGGGIAVVGGTAVFTSVTVTDNRPGGVFSSNAQPESRSSIFAGNRPAVPSSAPGDDIAGPITSLGYNLIGNASAGTIAPTTGDQLGTAANPINPVVGTLQNNGGPTLTHALLPGSPAIDKGISGGGPVTDQRGPGFSRTFDDPGYPNAQAGDGTDIGAFEVQSVSAPPTPTPTPTAEPTPAPTPTPTATPTATPTPTTPPSSLANISTRIRVETGDNVLIGGFIIAGAQPKRVLIRAIGPSLGLVGRLENPTLELFGPSGIIESNDDWVNSPKRQQIIDTTIAPSNDFESAILADLQANSNGYTAVVRGLNNTTGIGLVEVYDLDELVDSRLANISSRGLVQTGDNVMIGGVIVRGQVSARVLIRALGPSTGLAAALANPMLELRDQNGVVLQENDNWRTDQESEIAATNIPPPNDLESAIVRDLTPANYTAIVRGVGDSAGIGLVEVYRLP